MSYNYYYDEYDRDYEFELERAAQATRERYRSMSNEDLGKEWQRHCRRHDCAVDRCEELNSPTIEDAQRWMNFIEREFDGRAVNKYDFICTDE